MHVKDKGKIRALQGWDFYSAIKRIILELKIGEYDVLEGAFVDFYNFVVDKRKLSEEYLIGKINFLKEFLITTSDWKSTMAYILYGYIWETLNADQRYTLEAMEIAKKDAFFLDIQQFGRRIITPIIGFVYALVDDPPRFESKREIFTRLNEGGSDLLIQLFKLNYYFSLCVIGDKFDKLPDEDKREAIELSKTIVLNRTLGAWDKIIAFPFLEDKGQSNFKDMFEQIVPTEWYYYIFTFRIDLNSAQALDEWRSISPLKLIRFLFASENLGWNNLSLVSPSVLNQANRLRDTPNSIIIAPLHFYARIFASIVVGGFSYFIADYLIVNGISISSAILLVVGIVAELWALFKWIAKPEKGIKS